MQFNEICLRTIYFLVTYKILTHSTISSLNINNCKYLYTNIQYYIKNINNCKYLYTNIQNYINNIINSKDPYKGLNNFHIILYHNPN